MTANMGTADRAVRLAAAVVLAVVGVLVGGALSIVLYVVAAVFVLTSVVSFCPVYTLFGIRTCPAPKR